MQVTLTSVHYIYVAMVLVVLITMALRRDTVLPCIIGLFAIGYAATGNLVKTISVVFNSITTAGGEFIGIISVIALVVAMSKMMEDIGADYLVMRPAARIMGSAGVAFWVTGIAMMITSWFVWPSPAVALIGAILLPVAIRAGLPAIGAAMAMNLFGHGIALSSDWIIQGAPSITAKFAGLADASLVTNAGAPLFLVMAIVTTVTAYFMLKKDMAKNKDVYDLEIQAHREAAASAQGRNYGTIAWIIAIVTPIAFILDVVAMLKLDLKGGDATALVGGTAIAIMCIGAIGQYGKDSLEKITDYVRDGFLFGIKIFAPVIIIGAFFFLGSAETAQKILGPEATGLVDDLGKFLASSVPLSTAPVAFIVMLVGGIGGLDGSGFAPLPLVGSLAATFGSTMSIDIPVLAALGQISSVWVGGGTIIPWGLIPVAAICGVDPMELARKNFIPVVFGLIITTIVAIFLM
ncbi:MAG: hypothetical protein WA118_12830 [Carboxydocellales bacterium]